jgi:hypothetical protein
LFAQRLKSALRADYLLLVLLNAFLSAGDGAADFNKIFLKLLNLSILVFDCLAVHA